MENPTNGNMKALAAEDDSSHVLGLEKNFRFDILVASRGTTPYRNRTVTQRFVLSLVSGVCDSLGIVASYTVKARLLLKKNWRLSGQEWNDNLPDHLVDKFVEWVDELPKLTEKMIPRSYFGGQAE